MFGGTPQPQSQATIAAAATETPAEEEALKRNTDCVYFLASPLTCKKGGECEYRHSDIARVNPRDCWFWLNGNCLNPKCGFRHPPLDGLLGAQVPAPVGPSLPPSQTAATHAVHSPSISGKQGVSCIFFQKGFCLKGDRCPFLHAPNSANNKVVQLAAAPVITEPPTYKKAFGGLEKSTQEQKVPKNVPKSIEFPPQTKPVARVETASLRNGVVINKNVQPPTGLDDELSRYRPTNVPPASNGDSISRSNRVHQAHVSDDRSILNCKDADEFSREPSPGFDVLVDDELGDSDYYHNEDQFGRTRGHEGRNLNPMNDYDTGHSAEYNSISDVDRDIYRDPRGYESYERLQTHYAREEHRASSERMFGGPVLERRLYPRAESPDRVNESDLRHHLSKQKRGNGLRSVISRDHAHENHAEDRSYRAPRSDTYHLPPHESSLSSRLRGRIKMPGRSTSPVNTNDFRPEREMDRGRHRGRSSPGRPQISSHQGRLRDRIKGRVQEDFSEERTFRGPRIRRDGINDNTAQFTAPKSLAELKDGKNTESYEQHMNDRQPLGKRKFPKLEGLEQSEGDLSFEGPKPLSEILKRKRGTEAAVSESGITAGNNEDNNPKERRVLSSVSKDDINPVHSNKEGSMSVSSDIGGAEQIARLVHTERVKLTESRSSLQRNVSDLEHEEGMIGDEAMEDHEAEAYDQREGDCDYEQADGEDYNLDEGENADPEDDYYDDDDADDFAKKMGIIYS